MMGSQQLQPLRKRFTPRQLLRRQYKIEDRREYSSERHHIARARLQKLHRGWTARIAFALDYWRGQPQVTNGHAAVGLEGVRPSERRPGKYTPKILGNFTRRWVTPTKGA